MARDDHGRRPGSFAAISTLLGSPLLGAFLIMEAAGVGGLTLSLVALPGLLASGVGALVFVGLDDWTGLGGLLAGPHHGAAGGRTAHAGHDGVGAGHGRGRRPARLGDPLDRAVAASRRAPEPGPGTTGALGLVIGLTAMAYQLISDNSFTQVLFSGQDALPGAGRARRRLLGRRSSSSSALCKTFVYGLSLSAFRGGPVFPAMFIGAVLGIAASGLPGMSLAPAIAMGIGAMCAAMLRLPLTSTLLATLLLGADGVSVTPQVVIAVAVAFVLTHVLPEPGPKEPAHSAPAP